MAEIKYEELVERFLKLEASHEELKEAQGQTADTVKTLQGVKPAGPKKEPAFKPEDAENLDKSGKPENEYHFQVGAKKYKFTHGHVTPPVKPGVPPTKITAKLAQADKTLQAELVKIGSGQVKEVF